MDIKLLYSAADGIKPGWELCGSRWGNSEAGRIACQAIAFCALNHRTYGNAFSWLGPGSRKTTGGGLLDNPKGMQSLIDDKCIVVELYDGELTAPDGTILVAGKPMVITVTDRLLHYAIRCLPVTEPTT